MQSKITATLVTMSLLGLLSPGALGLLSPGALGEAPAVTSRRHNFTNFLPRFSFSTPVSPLFKLGSGDGALQNFQKLANTTRWQPDISRGVKSISQEVQFSELGALYNEATAQMGFLHSRGKIVADLGDNAFNVILSASNASGSCTLMINIEAPQLKINLDVSGLGALGRTIQGLSKLFGAISNFLSKLFTPTIPALLESLILDILHAKVDFNILCDEILKSTDIKYPEPKLSS